MTDVVCSVTAVLMLFVMANSLAVIAISILTLKQCKVMQLQREIQKAIIDNMRSEGSEIRVK